MAVAIIGPTSPQQGERAARVEQAEGQARCSLLATTDGWIGSLDGCWEGWQLLSGSLWAHRAPATASRSGSGSGSGNRAAASQLAMAACGCGWPPPIRDGTVMLYSIADLLAGGDGDGCVELIDPFTCQLPWMDRIRIGHRSNSGRVWLWGEKFFTLL